MKLFHGKVNDSGKNAERQAKQYLQSKGLTFIEANFSCRKGEIDLIMRDGEYLVFIEVKYRSNNRYGSPCEMVTLQKQQRIIQAAKHYLHKHHLTETTMSRFDVVGINPQEDQVTTSGTLLNRKKSTSIQWLKDAFCTLN